MLADMQQFASKNRKKPMELFQENVVLNDVFVGNMNMFYNIRRKECLEIWCCSSNTSLLSSA